MTLFPFPSPFKTQRRKTRIVVDFVNCQRRGLGFSPRPDEKLFIFFNIFLRIYLNILYNTA